MRTATQPGYIHEFERRGGRSPEKLKECQHRVARFLARVSALAIFCASLLLLVRVVGYITGWPGRSALDTYRCLPDPCWHGIRPGQTAMAEAEAILAHDESFSPDRLALPASERCWYQRKGPLWRVCLGPQQRVPGTIVGYIILKFGGPGLATESAPPLGNALLLFGPPRSATLCWYSFAVPVTNPARSMIADFDFGNGVDAEVYELRRPTVVRLDPAMPLFLVSYVPPENGQHGAARWRGFTSQSDQRTC